MSALNRTDFRALAFLKRGALFRVGGEWRFGLTSVGDAVVERLIATGNAVRIFPGTPSDCVILRSRR